MVEGPGATRNANKARRSLIGATIQSIECKVSSLDDFLGLSLQESLSVGKEVFLIFSDEDALRLHFGMNGVLTVVSSSHANNSNNRHRRRDKAMLTIHFSNNPSILQCFATTVNSVATHVARAKYQRLRTRDVCSPAFCLDDVFTTIVHEKSGVAVIADRLLDQDAFPGVGNIIKIEALHRAGIHPQQLVQHLNEQQLKCLICECRKYAMQWLQAGRAPLKLVYNLTQCQSCRQHNSIRLQKVGSSSLPRTTFWCAFCQPLLTGNETKKNNNKTTSAAEKFFLPRQKKATTAATRPNDNNFSNPDPVTANTDRPTTTTALPSCPRHGPNPCRLRRVRKATEHQYRLFVTCTACPSFFQWADSHFPVCHSCRRVKRLKMSKTAQTGGRWFLSCNNNNNNCRNSFAWATDKELAPLSSKLTPLL